MNNKLKESVAKALIELKNISKIYKRNNTETKALNDINLHINKGDIFGVIGFSGAGKSTLIRLVNYLEKPTTEIGRASCGKEDGERWGREREEIKTET